MNESTKSHELEMTVHGAAFNRSDSDPERQLTGCHLTGRYLTGRAGVHVFRAVIILIPGRLITVSSESVTSRHRNTI